MRDTEKTLYRILISVICIVYNIVSLYDACMYSLMCNNVYN